MAQGTTVVLMPQTAYPGPPGSSQTYVGIRQQAAAYYLANRDLQTLTWNLGQTPQPQHQNGNPVFVGNIEVQASIATAPASDSDWFNVYSIDTTPDQYNVQAGFYNLKGNYVWLRVVVTNWTQGPVSLITANY